jgi:hypothetical protein
MTLPTRRYAVEQCRSAGEEYRLLETARRS